MMNHSAAITIENLATGYKTKHGFKIVSECINATLYRGRLTCLLGPNGAGKSTLLKTLSGMIPPLRGRILIGTRPMSEFSPRDLAQEIGVVLTERLMVSNMSVMELISLGRSPYTGFWGKPSNEDESIVNEAIRMVGIVKLQDRMIQTLSDGERQKVMIAKALAQDTPIIFLDEPTAFLDYPSKVEILQLLLRLTREKGITAFLSTHDLELALQIADEAWLIDKKYGVTVGTPEDLALNGDLGRYFEREGVEFDLDSGLFKICGNSTTPVCVKGSGVRNSMVCKALRRIGMNPSVSPASITINVHDNGYELNGVVYASIAELLGAIAHLASVAD